jgi:HK97 gp10 family phage protein
MDGITLSIRGSFKGNFDEISKEMPNIEKRALYKAAYFLRDKIQQSLISAVPKATQKNPKYIDTLVDAVGFSRVDGASTTINAMGTRKTGSGTYRTRFFEEGTVKRYHKKRNGIRLKKKKYIGFIKPTHFFSSAVNANKDAAVKLMEDVLTEYVDTAFKKNT